jgi:membrane protein required for colicin V production
MKIADFILDSRVGALDRTLGFVFGAIRGALLVVVGLLFYNWLVPDSQPAWIADAKSKPMLESIGESIVALLPEDPEKTIINKLKPKDEGADTGAADDNSNTDDSGADPTSGQKN